MKLGPDTLKSEGTRCSDALGDVRPVLNLMNLASSAINGLDMKA